MPNASWLNAVGVQRFAVHHAGRVKDVELQTWVSPQDDEMGRVYYRLPIEIGVASGEAADTRIERVIMTERQHVFRIASGVEPASVTIDPETWLLTDTVTFTKRQ